MNTVELSCNGTFVTLLLVALLGFSCYFHNMGLVIGEGTGALNFSSLNLLYLGLTLVLSVMFLLPLETVTMGFITCFSGSIFGSIPFSCAVYFW